MNLNGKKRHPVRHALVYLTFAAALLPNPFSPKKASASKKPITEDIRKIIFGKWSGGTCNLNLETGSVTYRLKNGKMESFSLPQDCLSEEKPFLLSCGDDKTAVVAPNEVTVVWRGAENTVGKIFKGVFSVIGVEDDEIGNPIATTSIENSSKEKNIDAFGKDGELLVLTKNTKTKECSITDIKSDGEPSSYSIGKRFNKKAKIFFYKDIVFVGGETGKKQVFLLAAKIDDTGDMSIMSFSTMKKLKGKVSFEIKDNSLLLKVGKNTTKINVVNPKKELPTKSTAACFSEEEKTFSCINIITE